MHAQNCPNDITPPTAICHETYSVALGPNGTYEVPAANFNNSSFDDCCPTLTFSARRVEDGPCDSDGSPDAFGSAVTFCCAEGGTMQVTLRVEDCSGNSSECIMTVTLQDKSEPICKSPAHLTVSCQNFDPTLQAYEKATVTDNCCIDTSLILLNYTQFDTVCNKGTIVRTFQTTDCSGNSSQCSQRIVVQYEQFYCVRFPDDVVLPHSAPPTYNFGSPIFSSIDCELMGASFTDEIYTWLPDVAMKIERTWKIVNWCTYNSNMGLTIVPNPNPNATVNHPDNLLGPVVGPSGAPAPCASSVVKINPSDPAPTDYSSYWSLTTNGYTYKQIIKIVDTSLVMVQGKVFYDTLENCTYDGGEKLLEGWKIRITGSITGQEWEVVTDSSGFYQQWLYGLDTLVTVVLVSPVNVGNCSSVFTLNATPGTATVQDIPIQLQQECPVLSVDISSLRLRRCFSNNFYQVNACNLSALLVQGAYVEVALDEHLSYESSSIPATPLGNNFYSFALDDLAAAECTSFSIRFTVGCDAPLGATHCTEAHIFPDTLCNWIGPALRASGNCDGDSVRLTLRNAGNPMTQSVEFVVVEDVIMRQSGGVQLGQNEVREFVLPANGSTWRLQAGQVPDHPWGGPIAATVEGCGGFNMAGLVTLFPLNNNNPFISLDCQQNIGSYDPNDKSAAPQGYGNEHFIEQNTGLDYLIRFQNTGTDTAFTVVVLDTLSPYVNPATVRPGASSHPYDFAVLDGNILRFTFANILLPDSNTNEAASHGFFKYRVAQQPDLPDGTRIENRAAIYFDFNAPVLTNTTYHTIGDHFIQVSSIDEIPNGGLVRVYPNPATDAVFFELKNWMDAGRFTLTNSLGQSVWADNFAGKQYRLDRKNLAVGMYHFQILSENGGVVGAGKVVLK